MISTGLSIALPTGYECQVRSRSGLAAKNGVFALNSPGTIDEDFSSEVKVILQNTSPERYVIKQGDRIAQVVMAKVYQAVFFEVETIEETGRGGMGSTGK
jgi:dUTP pyrophosphatase